MKDLVKEYKNSDITVVWVPSKCTRSMNCFQNLKAVFNPEQRPWIQMDKGETDEIIKTVELCPSSALSYYFNKGPKERAVEADPNVKVKLVPEGPVKIDGYFSVLNEDGTTEIKNEIMSFCRCGKSLKLPYCDGMHKTMDAWKKLNPGR